MKLKFGIIIALMSFGICLSLTEALQPNTTSILIRSREPRSPGAVFAGVKIAYTVMSQVVSIVTGMESFIKLIQNDRSDDKFKEDVTKKLNDIYTVCTKIDTVDGKIDKLSKVIEEVVDQLQNLKTAEFIDAENIARDFKKKVDLVNNNYKNNFIPIWRNINRYQSHNVNDRFKKILDNGVLDTALSEMLSAVESQRSKSSIFAAMSKYYDPKNGYQFQCESASPLDHLHIFYAHVIKVFTRGYAIILMTYDYWKRTSDDFPFFHDQQTLTFQIFKETIESVTKYALRDFDSLKNSNYKGSFACDPQEWKEGENFIRVKNYVSVQHTQNYWGNHVNDPEAVAKSKEYDCPYGWAEYKAQFENDPDTITQVCTAPFSPTLANPYSVEYKEFKSPLARVWESRRCRLGTTNYLGGICESDHDSDTDLSIRKLSLRVQSCDTSKNEVVTDARFHEQDHKIHIKLRCGVIKNGTIDPYTLRWTEDNERFSEVKPREYVVLSSKLKSFNLDDVVVPNGVLVTGAGFKVVDDHFISLVVKGNKINNYNHENTFGADNLYSAPKSRKPRKGINIDFLERPPKKMSQTYEMSKAGENYINLTLSKYSDEYNNEAVVPYFDMTPYGSKHGLPAVTPLGGLGLFYKSLPGYAGFFAFKHLSPTYVYYVNNEETFKSPLKTAEEPHDDWYYR